MGWQSLDAIRPIVADFNGDGLVDLLLKVFVSPWCEPELGPCQPGANYWRLYTRDPGTTTFRYYDTLALDTASTDPRITLGDINGDGLTDVAYAEGTGNVWKYRLSSGAALSTPTTIVTLASTTERTALADFNGDGRQDFLYTANGTWYARLATETGLSATATNTGLPSTESGYGGQQSGWLGYFHDVNGDGRADYSRFFLGDDTAFTNAYVRLGADPFTPANVVTTIENGFGATTEIEYQAFTDPSRASNYYTKSTDGRLANWGKLTPVIDLFAPLYAVKRVQSSAPAAGTFPDQVDNNALSAVSYRYGGAKLQGGGRGFLGFASLTTVDEQNMVETTTSYRQDFPYTGYPATTTVKTGTGMALSTATNTWLDQTGGTGTFRQPYLSQSVEHACDLATATTTCASGGSALLSTVTTTTTVNAYGNALTVNVSTLSQGITYGKATTNTYSDDVPNWKLGRLTNAVVTHSRTGHPNVVRTAAFHYADGSKILDQEITEPNGSLDQTLTTTYALDDFGNRQSATVTGWDGTAVVERATTLTFDTAGRFVDETRNAYNQLTQSVTERNDRGQPERIFNIDGVPTDIRYGEFGVEYFRRDPTGAFSHTERALCSQLGDCPGTAHFRQRTTVAGGGVSDVYVDLLGREVRAATVGFDGTEIYVDTEYDNLGRVKRKSEPYFSGASAVYWTEFDYDLLGRVTEVRHPDYATTGNTTTSDYAGFVTTMSNGNLQEKIETRNAVGELVKTEDDLGNRVDYTYDATGNLKSSVQHATDTAATATATLTYDKLGRKTAMTDADMGTWGYDYNAFGELIKQETGVSGKYTTVAYDLLGRMTSRIDWVGGTAQYTGGSQEANAGWLYDVCSHGLGKLCQEDTTPGVPGPSNPPSLVRTFGYDAYGRSATISTSIGTVEPTVTASTTYDQYGRVFQAFDGADTYSGLEYQYNAFGYRSVAIEARGSAYGTVEHYRIEAQNERGQVTQLVKGGITVTRNFEADTGRIESIQAQTYLLQSIQDYSFTFDVLGNLTGKADLRRSLSESYFYDGLNRLTSVTGSSSLTMDYDGLGNIASKSDLAGSYGYGSRPHAVSSAAGLSYSYDGNGNLTGASDGRVNAFTVFNKPYAMSRGSNSVTLDYGPNREHFRRIDVQSGQATTTHIVGSIEKIWRPGGVFEIKRYLDGDVLETIQGSTRTLQYLFVDQLGSLDVITDASGVIVQSMTFDAFGKRRNPVDYSVFTDPMIFGYDTSRTTRGFTFHEQLDPVGYIHMNGRVYDPTLGRFISADPFVQDPSNTQSLNRYSYVFNNPLSYTDPSGYFSTKEAFGIVVAAVVSYYTFGAFEAVGILESIFAGAAAGAAGSFASTVAMGGSLNAAFTSAGYGALGGAAFAGVGASNWAFPAKVAAHGITGGVMAELQGGSFGHGFVAAGLTKAINVNDRVGIAEELAPARVIVAAIIGGTVSEMTGGDFANGAMTAAMAQVLNGEQETETERAFLAARERLRQIPEFLELEKRVGELEIEVTSSVEYAELSTENVIQVNPRVLSMGYRAYWSAYEDRYLQGLSDEQWWVAADAITDYFRFSPERIILHETFHATQDRSALRYTLNQYAFEAEAIDFTNPIMLEHFREPFRGNYRDVKPMP